MKILKSGQYYGAKKRELDVSGIKLSEYDYLTPGTDWHYHENPYFMYVMQGGVYEINKRSREPCPSGSFIFHNWEELHRNVKASPLARGFHVELSREWIERNGPEMDVWRGSTFIDHPDTHLLLNRIYLEFRSDDQFSKLSLEALSYGLVESAGGVQRFGTRARPPWIDRLKEILHEAPEDLSLDTLAEELGVHPVHISRSVPRYLGESLGSYIRKGKLKKSLGLLRRSKHSLTEVANICGFSDQSHFTRTFKTCFGCTPSSFRKKMR